MSTTIEQNIYEQRKSERGAALIATIAILALVSVFLTVGLNLFYVESENDRRLETRTNMEFVIDQISSYVQRENRLPCPADPAVGVYGAAPNFGQEDRAGGGACNPIIGGEFAGLVPFRTLNIDERYARDAWGRYLTYAISPVFGDTRNNAGDAQVFYLCRRGGDGGWVDSSNPLDLAIPPPATAANERKARFCCPRPIPAGNGPGNDIEILDETGAPINLRPDQAGAPVAGTPQRDDQTVEPGAWGDIATADASLPGDFINYVSNANIVTFAMVLISHGENGHGAYLGDGSTGRNILAAGFGNNEQENADFDTDNIFVDAPMVTAEGSNNYFDDIVLWRTQFSLYNELNNASCSRPWR